MKPRIEEESHIIIIKDDETIHGHLSDDELRKLTCEPRINEFQRFKLEKDSKKNWDLFYKRNGDRFFKNRYWTKREFKELFYVPFDNKMRQDDANQIGTRRRCLLEIGCGCGNLVIPLLEDFDKKDNRIGDDCDFDVNNLFIYCTDISEKAIDLLKANPIYKCHHPNRISAFVADLTEGDWGNLIDKQLGGSKMDIISMVFVLSALDPSKMQLALKNVSRVIKPNGLVLFRDYGIYDKAMLRFSEKSKISDRFYVRQDGTRAYFFTKKQLIELFSECDFNCFSIDYIKSETFNHATEVKYSRIFLQAKFIKKSTS